MKNVHLNAEIRFDSLNKAVTLRLLGNVVKVQINGINGSERLKDLTNVVLAQREW